MNFDNTTIKMTKKGNLRIAGKKYVAEPGSGCSGCVFALSPKCYGAVCTPGPRTDAGYPLATSVIFIRKQKTEAV